MIPLGVRVSTKISKIPGIQDWHQVPEGSKETSQHEFMRQICSGWWPLRTFPALRCHDSQVKSKVLLGFGSSYSLCCFGVELVTVPELMCQHQDIPAFFDSLSVEAWKHGWLPLFIWRAKFGKLFVAHFFKKIKAIKIGGKNSCHPLDGWAGFETWCAEKQVVFTIRRNRFQVSLHLLLVLCS